MGFLEQIASHHRSMANAAKPPTLRATFVCGEKGGVGKTTIAELLAILLLDLRVPFSVAECEAASRLGRRLGGSLVQHHPLHDEDFKRLAEDPDLLNRYWDRVLQQISGGMTIVDMAANSLALALRWAASRSVNARLSAGAGLHFVLVATADSSSLASTLTSARQLRKVLPAAQIWVVLNSLVGTVSLTHPGVALLLEETMCREPIVLPVCRAPDAAILKNLGRFDRVALMPVEELCAHGVDELRAGRALEAFQDWVLDGCLKVRPIVADVLPGRR